MSRYLPSHLACSDESVVRVAQVAVPRQDRRDSLDQTQEAARVDLVDGVLEGLKMSNGVPHVKTRSMIMRQLSSAAE